MKFSNKVSGLAIMAAMALSSQAFALDVLTTGGLTAAGVAIGGLGGGMLVGTGAITSIAELSQGTADSRQAVNNASQDAIVVLKGGQATDTFETGKRGAEQLLNTRFGSNYDAALAILEIASAQ